MPKSTVVLPDVDSCRVGIDLQAEGYGWALWSNDMRRIFAGWHKLPRYKSDWPPHKKYERLRVLVRCLDAPPFHRIGRARLGGVYLERPYGPSRNAQSTMMQLNGAMIGGLTEAGVPVYELNTSTWKKRLFGKGNADKDYIVVWATQNLKSQYLFSKKPERQDVWDAMCILAAGLMMESENILPGT